MPNNIVSVEIGVAQTTIPLVALERVQTTLPTTPANFGIPGLASQA